MVDEKKMKQKEAKRRNSIDGLKRLDQFVVDYVPALHQGEVVHRLERLEKVWEAFEVVQEEYEELDDSEAFVKQNLELRAQVEQLYFRVKAAMVSNLPPRPIPVVPGPSSAPAAPPTLSNVKLPTISLPEFDGDFNTWLTFHDTFLSLIHSSTEISQVQKFHYLRAALKGEAANCVQSITITAENYAVAWQTLVSRYSNKAILRKKHIRALLKYPKIPNNNVDALHKIVDEFQRHTKVLEQLGEPVNHFSSILIELLEDKLDDASLTAWEESIAVEEHPTYDKMVEFLQKRARILETIAINRPQHASSKPNMHNPAPKKPNQPRSSTIAAAEVSVKTFPICPACDRERHSLYECTVFNGLDAKGRLKIVTDRKLCSNCFRSDHFVQQCRSKFRCRHCSQRHHSMIHPGPFEMNRTNPDAALNNPSVTTAVVANPVPEVISTVKSSNANVLLTTVVLIVVDAYGQEHIARALLDTGSQPNAISERLCQQLHLPRKLVNVPIAGVDSIVTNAKYEIRAEIRSRVAEFSESLDFLVLRKVTRDTPSVSFSPVHWDIPGSFSLADPDFHTSRRVDMIIGAAHFYSFLQDGRFRLPVQGSLLVETVFGWIVAGKFSNFGGSSSKPAVTCHVATVDSISEQLERFGRIEELQVSTYSVDEQACEDFFCNTVSRDPTGRYIVRNPKHPDFEQMIGASKPAALHRFQLLERKLSKDGNVKIQYHDFMREYLSHGHMAAIPEEDEDDPNACYLPHHPVFKESSSTSPIRIVYDGSAKTSSGKSLNESLLVVVQHDLFSLVLRFRKYLIALVADIDKMYRQIVMHILYHALQRILWRFDSLQPLRTYELSRTYGLAPSSFLATRALLQLVEDEGAPYPNASKAIKKNTYIDDIITGANSIELPEDLQRLQKGQMVSHKSSLCLLSPFIDAEGLIRVGGRLELSDAPFDVKHQIVIPGFHPFTQLLLKHVHRKLVHGGIMMTLSVVRDEFWPLNGRRAVRSVIRQCYQCCRANPQPIQQPIGQLPIGRVTANEAFACTGVDYCGPIYLKPTHRRAAARKSYICVFVCLSTRAVHLELVSDLSTAAFLMALDRFIWRRNKPQHIYSDNGTNFIGAKNELHALYTMLQPGSEGNRIAKQLAEDNIQWHLIPPRAPNFGGLWEAAVKVAKTQLVRQLGSSLLSFEELSTVLIKIEGCMNSRPLLPLSSDLNDLATLTPAHFLVRNMIRPLPEADVRNVPFNLLNQYEKLQKYSQVFWHRWRTEYLKELNVQYRTNPKRYHLNVGDIVIVKDESLPPARWPLARVVELHPGPDGVTRVVGLRTPTKTMKRAVCKICPLECAVVE